ncbi:MAG TPA: hypothetical protein VK838_02695 [Candidatus Limnocylindrales bacterium]|nr:hypothetical protein [Candidatus Limnocylindrales bacterium]
MNPVVVLAALIGYAPVALFVFAPACATLARRRQRDAETWLLLGGALGPLALGWIALLPARPRSNDAQRLESSRRRTPPSRIPRMEPRPSSTCQLCGESLIPDHHCRPEVVEDRIQRRWTVRVGGQRIIGGF